MFVNSYLKLDANLNVRSHCIVFVLSQENIRGKLEFVLMRTGMFVVLLLCCLDSMDERQLQESKCMQCMGEKKVGAR